MWQFRESLASSASLGFRIEGCVRGGQPMLSSADIKKLQSTERISAALRGFVLEHGTLVPRRACMRGLCVLAGSWRPSFGRCARGGVWR